MTPPFFITDRDEPYRPGLVLWVDGDNGLVVGQKVVPPEEIDGAVASVLLAALEKPAAGPRRRPLRVRVEDHDVAAEVRDVLGDDVTVTVAPTPELDQVLAAMAESFAGSADDASYLGDNAVTPATVARMFEAAKRLWTVAPWRHVHDDHVVRLDIPALGVDGACVSIIGALGQSFGILIFSSPAGFEGFCRMADEPPTSRGKLDFGSDWLSLTFARGADLSGRMRREIAEHGWPVADARAYPQLERHERDGVERPLVERDLRIAAACATSLALFCSKHSRVFADDHLDPLCESYFDSDDLEVRLTLPYHAVGLFDVNAAPAPTGAAQPKVGRNDPCPCGSGKKYKKCHQRAVGAAEQPSPARDAPQSHGDLERTLIREMSRFAEQRFGDLWFRFARDFDDFSEALMLAVPWSVYHFLVEGRTVCDWFLEERGTQLSKAAHGWLSAQTHVWMSIWQVVEVDAGRSLMLRDLLSHEERRVEEASASQILRPGDAVLARIVDQEGRSLLCGGHPQILPSELAQEVAARARKRVRRKRAVPIERLRDERVGRYLIKRWEAVAHEHEDHFAGTAQSAQSAQSPRSAADQAELDRAVLEYKKRHYSDWIDQPLPALAERTPREAVRTAGGRKAVAALLDDMEAHERTTETATAFDFSALRRKLGV